MTIRKDGSVVVDYVGQFTDLRRFAEASESERSRASTNNFPADSADFAKEQKLYVEKIRRINGVHEFRYLGNDLYQLRYRSTGNLENSDIPELVDAQITDLQQKIPGFIKLRAERDNSRFSTPDDHNAKSSEEWKSLYSENGAMAKEIRRLFQQLKGTLNIRTDAYVETHNAHQVQKISGGMTEYQWRITGDNVFDVRFSFSLDAPDETRFDASRYPPGTDCIKAFGKKCKCSFVLARRGAGKPMANTAYRIETQSGKVVEGCTDAKGNTEVVTENVTGSCNLIMLDSKESAARCKSE